ncbi:MAG: NADH-quinone oxidoreductase subunit NuoN [Geminicoccaceae bacterium]
MDALVNLPAAAPEIFLALVALVLMILGAFRDDAENARLITFIAVGALIIAAIMPMALDRGPAVTFDGHYIVDGFSSFMKCLVAIAAAAGLAISSSYFERIGLERFEYPLLALFSTLGMMMMLSANSFLALYMALELNSLPLYVMAAFRRDTIKSTEAGLKYFVLGALASGMLLYGCSLVYGFTGTIMFPTLAELYTGAEAEAMPAGAIVGMVFVAAGLVFKLGAVPFHMWTPDVYEGAPTPVTAFFAAAPKIAAMGLTIRVFDQAFGGIVDQWQQVLIVVAVLSMALGAFAAIGQTNIKRLMGYSSIGHVGYALVGLCAGTENGAFGVILYMAIYMVMTLGTFACILALRRRNTYVENINDFRGLGKDQPMLAFAVAVFMFSLAGIPPLAGFFGKLYVFLAAVEAGLYILAVIAVVTSVVGAYYYLRIVKLMYFDEAEEPLEKRMDGELIVISGAATIFTAFFVVLPGPIVSAAQTAAASLFT